jgi:hypothetical protein
MDYVYYRVNSVALVRVAKPLTQDTLSRIKTHNGTKYSTMQLEPVNLGSQRDDVAFRGRLGVNLGGARKNVALIPFQSRPHPL